MERYEIEPQKVVFVVCRNSLRFVAKSYKIEPQKVVFVVCRNSLRFVTES